MNVFWLARNVGNEGPSTFTLVYWVFIPSFPTKGQLVFGKEAWRLHNFDVLLCKFSWEVSLPAEFLLGTFPNIFGNGNPEAKCLDLEMFW